MTCGARSVVRCLVASSLLALLAPAGATAAAPPDTGGTPTITVLNAPFPDDTVVQGATFKFEGAGWPADALIEVEVCGAEARSGTSDCAVDTAQVVASNASGYFQGRIAVAVPPSPCPCVIRAVSQTSSHTATTPVEIPNAPTSHPGDGDVVAPALRRLEVDKVVLRGSDSWATWFGAPARRTFEFELLNTGSVPVRGATVTFVVGPAGNPTGFVKPVKIERVEVGERQKFAVPVEFDALAFGEQAVRATMNGTSVPVTFKATTSTHPWLLIIIPAVVLGQLVLVGTRNVLRRRLHDTDYYSPPVMVAAVSGPADDSLICVVELTETGTDASTPADDDEAVEEFADHLVVADAELLDADDDGDGVVTVHELVAATADPTIATAQHHTVVLRSISAVKQLVRDSLTPADGAPARTINAITVLADADARLGDAHEACDDLCVWIDAAFTDAGTPLALRRRHVTAGNGGMGMVPLTVLVRSTGVAA